MSPFFFPKDDFWNCPEYYCDWNKFCSFDSVASTARNRVISRIISSYWSIRFSKIFCSDFFFASTVL